MTNVVRINDRDSGGDRFITGSSRVLTNALPTVRISDINIGPRRRHVMVTGFSRVIIEGQPVCRLGIDIDSAGDTPVTGSPNVVAS